MIPAVEQTPSAASATRNQPQADIKEVRGGLSSPRSWTVEVHSRKDDTMSDQTKNAQPSPSEKMPKNAGGVDDIEESEDRVEIEDPVKVDEGTEDPDARQAGGGRQSESDKPSSPDSRFGSERKS